jgi:hypothetical protein
MFIGKSSFACCGQINALQEYRRWENQLVLGLAREHDEASHTRDELLI